MAAYHWVDGSVTCRLPVPWDRLRAQCSATSMGELYLFYTTELEQILVLTLEHIWYTIDRLSTALFLQTCIGLTAPVISVGGMSSLMLAHHYQ